MDPITSIPMISMPMCFGNAETDSRKVSIVRMLPFETKIFQYFGVMCLQQFWRSILKLQDMSERLYSKLSEMNHGKRRLLNY